MIIDKSSATIQYFGIGHIYSHIIQVTANIPANERTLVIVDKITPGQTSFTAVNIASSLVFQVSFLSSKCLCIFSTTTIESSTNIHITNINAKSVILFILSHDRYANKNTRESISGIEVAVFSAFLNHKNNMRITITIIIAKIRSKISTLVASFAFFHSF